jgi:phosphohistidine phosphatase
MLNLYIIRHTEAVPLGQDGIDTDEARPLTPAGAAACKPLAAALKRLAPKLDKLLASPLVRAKETATGIAEHWGDKAPHVIETPTLTPGTRKRELLETIRDTRGRAIGLVGHNPDLSELVGWLIGDRNVGIELEKGGMACVRFAERAGKGTGSLVWMVTPEWYGE